jgi:hypothetical protein
VLLYTRIFYASVVLLQLGIYYWVTLKIKQKNDLKVLKYTEPAKPMSGEGPTQVTTTVKDYDLAEASKAIRGVLMGLLFVSFTKATDSDTGLGSLMAAVDSVGTDGLHARLHEVHAAALHPGNHAHQVPLRLQGAWPVALFRALKVLAPS